MNSTYFCAQYSRFAKRRGPNKPAVAVGHSMLVAIWWALTTGALYQDPGPDFYQRQIDPEREAKRLLARIEALGFDVSVTPKAAA